MRTDLGTRTIAYPMPVFIIGTYNEDGTANAMNAAWGGVTGEYTVSICVDRSHKTAENVKKRKAFTVSMGTADTVDSCDYVGIVSGNDVKDKFFQSGFHEVKGKVDAPLIRELPVALECEMVSYDDKTEILTGNIVNVSVDDSVLTDGKIDLSKFRPITYDPSKHDYIALGEKVGDAFKDGKKLF